MRSLVADSCYAAFSNSFVASECADNRSVNLLRRRWPDLLCISEQSVKGKRPDRLPGADHVRSAAMRNGRWIVGDVRGGCNIRHVFVTSDRQIDGRQCRSTIEPGLVSGGRTRNFISDRRYRRRREQTEKASIHALSRAAKASCSLAHTT